MGHFFRLTGRCFRALAVALGCALLTTGCTSADGGEVYARCKPREVRRVEADGDLASALARQAAENQTYRDCVERRSVRVAR